jgi:hypothetical protein
LSASNRFTAQLQHSIQYEWCTPARGCGRKRGGGGRSASRALAIAIAIANLVAIYALVFCDVHFISRRGHHALVVFLAILSSRPLVLFFVVLLSDRARALVLFILAEEVTTPSALVWGR